MIHLHRGLCLLLTREPGTEDEQWLDQLDAAGGDLQMVLVEGVESTAGMMCPHCCLVEGQPYESPTVRTPVCRGCNKMFVALAFPAATARRSWFTFPWQG